MVDLELAKRNADRLTQLVSADRSALLIVEMQKGVVGPGSGLPALAAAGAEIGLVDHVAKVAAGARRRGVPVIHCTAQSLPGGFGRSHNARLFAATLKAGMDNAAGSDSVRPVQEVGPEVGDLELPRLHGLSPMNGSALDQLLRNEGIGTVVVVGVSLNVAIPNLVFDAVNHSYQAVVISDAVAGVPIEYGALVLENTLSLVATLATTDELLQAWATA